MRLPLLALTLLLCGTSHADLIATYRFVPEGKKIAHSPETRVVASEHALLRESWSGTEFKDGTHYSKVLTLTQYDQKREVVMDTALKIYKVEPIIGPSAGNLAPRQNLKVTKIGEEDALDFKADHYTIDFLTDVNRLFPKTGFVRQNLWIVPASKMPGLPKKTQTTYQFNSADVTEGKELLGEIGSGLTIKMQLTFFVPNAKTAAKVFYGEELSSVTRCELDPSVFEIPGDYKEVSAAEFASLQRKMNGEIVTGHSGIRGLDAPVTIPAPT